ncbi:15540_t:CDS:1, partial [Gigaspora rosea]
KGNDLEERNYYNHVERDDYDEHKESNNYDKSKEIDSDNIYFSDSIIDNERNSQSTLLDNFSPKDVSKKCKQK